MRAARGVGCAQLQLWLPNVDVKSPHLMAYAHERTPPPEGIAAAGTEDGCWGDGRKDGLERLSSCHVRMQWGSVQEATSILVRCCKRQRD